MYELFDKKKIFKKIKMSIHEININDIIFNIGYKKTEKIKDPKLKITSALMDDSVSLLYSPSVAFIIWSPGRYSVCLPPKFTSSYPTHLFE